MSLRRSAGIAHFRLHDLRHFMATQMLAANVPISVVSERLAHARTSTPLNVYAHAIPGADFEAAQVMGNLLGRHAIDRCCGEVRQPSLELEGQQRLQVAVRGTGRFRRRAGLKIRLQLRDHPTEVGPAYGLAPKPLASFAIFANTF